MENINKILLWLHVSASTLHWIVGIVAVLAVVFLLIENFSRRRYESKAAKLAKELDSERLRLELVLQHMTDGITIRDYTGKLVYANEAAARLCGYESPEQLVQSTQQQIEEAAEMHSEEGLPVSHDQAPWKQTLQDKQSHELVVQFRKKDKPDVRWLSIKSVPIPDDHGNLLMVISAFRDTTREREAAQVTELAAQRREFLRQAEGAFGGRIDYEEALKQVAKLAVPRLADWVAIDMLDETATQVNRVAVINQDSEKSEWGYKMRQVYHEDLSSNVGIPMVLKSGQTQYYPAVSSELLGLYAKNTEHMEVLLQLKLVSVIMTPLKKGEKTVGAITFAATGSRPAYTKEDVSLAEELSRRASLAIEHASLYQLASSTAKKEHEQAALLDNILDKAPIGFALVNADLTFARINQTLASVHGKSVEEHAGRTLKEISPELSLVIEPVVSEVLATGNPVLNVEVSHTTEAEPNKKRLWMENFYPVYTNEHALLGVGIIAYEITHQKDAEEEIRFRAYYDALTRLPNRKYFEERLAGTLEAAEAAKSKFAVMFLDLDRLKDINDTLGHDVGDAVLKEMAQRMNETLKRGGFIARWGGDEFVILIPEIRIIADVISTAEAVLQSLQPVMHIGNHDLHVTGSIGIAVYPSDGEDMQTLQKNADTALYRAKDGGRNRFELYTPSMNYKSMEKFTLENDLRQALDRRELELYFQPILDLKSNTITGAETLLRWRHPRLGFLSPAKFIPLAEEIGLIVPLGKWVLASAAEAAVRWRHEGMPVTVSVNVSARQFADPGLVGHIASFVQEKALSPGLIEIEITESIAMENFDRSRRMMRQLNELGVSVSIDDFGVGYSSLNYLKRFPIDKLKVDKSFIRHSITNPQDTSLVKAIVSLAKSLGLKVVAEGVDSETQLELLRSLGCDAAQGYYISRPLTVSEFAEFVRQKNAPPQVSGAAEEVVLLVEQEQVQPEAEDQKREEGPTA